MANADELTHVGMEIVTEGSKLTGEVLLKVLQSITELLEKEKTNQDFVIKDNTKDGKQRIKDLIKKHSDGVIALDDDVTKDQLKDYQQQFKKLGVDFSVVNNGEDSYSFFFASKDINVIEKSLKNIIEQKNKQNELGKEKESEVDSIETFVEKTDGEKILEEKVSEQVKLVSPENAYEEAMVIQENFGLTSNVAEFDNQKFLNHLKENDPQTYNDFVYLKELNSNFQNTKDLTASKPERVKAILDQLTDKEKVLFMQLGKYHSEQLDNHFSDSWNTRTEEKDFLNGILHNFNDEERQNVKQLFGENISTSSGIRLPEETITVDELLSIVDDSNIEIKYNDMDFKDLKAEKKLEQQAAQEAAASDLQSKRDVLAEKYSSKEEQLGDIFKELNPTEREYFMQSVLSSQEQIYHSDMGDDTDTVKLFNMRDNMDSNSVSKVEKLYELHVHSEDSKAPKGSIHINDVEKITKQMDKNKFKQSEKSSPNIFTVDGVKEIDRKIREQDKDKNKDKKRNKEVSR